MKSKSIEKPLKILVLSFIFLNVIGVGCGRGGSLISTPSGREMASNIGNSKSGVPGGSDGENGSNGVPGGSDGESGSNGVPGGSDGENGSNGVPGGSDGENGSNGVPGGSDGENGSNGVPGGSDGGSLEKIYSFSITQTAREQKEVDILMVMDNSCSMYGKCGGAPDRYGSLKQRFGNFLSDDLQRVDWQMAFISSAFGTKGRAKIFYNLLGVFGVNNQKVLSSQLDNPENIFQNTLSSGQGGAESYMEFQAILNMINSPETHPERFFRPNALLAIVIITDENDTTNVRASDIITAVQNNLDQELVTYGLIAEPGDIECGQEPLVDINYKVADLVQKTGGITGSVCDEEDYGNIMADIGNHVERVLVYHEVMLKHANVVEDSITLNCSLSGSSVECPSWEFDSESNKILFDSPPEEGVTVEISYSYQP